jgi:hypothetical protein
MGNLEKKQTGSILVTVLIMMIFLASLLFGLVVLANANLYRARGRLLLLQAQYSAESGADEAIARLNSGNTAYAGTGGEITVLDTGQYRATFSTTVASGADPKVRIITSVGKVYAPRTSSTPSHMRTIRVTAERTSTTTASSIVSRNIIDIASGVKSLTARDIYVNNYIVMQKNTTDLIAENITVAGKNTTAANCSLVGPGNLIKPTIFSDPSQTKTRLTLAYNNCINPPGNTSDADFDVSVNNTNISKIQSTYIPWSHYMDSSYQNSVSGCSDWTGGGAIRNIPSTGNDRKTHYPDSASNLSMACGTSGNLDLDANQYNIRNHAHVRANFCATTACNPTFNNPDPDIKFVFIEGTINFDSVQTSAGSGPIAFIVYGVDPPSKTSVCPYGGAAFIGQDGSSNTNAPNLFIMAMNGLCLDNTKFDSSPALGGIGGKNIYVATSPSTPRPLGLDPNFPVNEIPIDLFWRQTTYERL